jgi:hypothetical protein
MKHIKIKKFSNEALKANLTDSFLFETLSSFIKLNRDEQLKYSLGAGLYKLRIATKEGRGKSGGSRSIMAFKNDKGVFWLHLFSKNDKGNVSTSELKKLKQLADIMFDLTDDQIIKLINLGELLEVKINA